MQNNTKLLNSFENNIKEGIKALKENDYINAEIYIKYALQENCHSPEVHNLFGILSEFTGDLSLAGKYYRAALAFDPAYKPADRNLLRITSFYSRFEKTTPDFGDKPVVEKNISYTIEYDKNNVGHLKKIIS